MNDRQRIQRFIERFHGSENTFLHGCCYWFARILNDQFSIRYGAEIMYEPVEGHFLTCIHGRYYDIRGDVSEAYRGKPMYILSELRRENSTMYRHLMRDCRDFEEVEYDG